MKHVTALALAGLLLSSMGCSGGDRERRGPTDGDNSPQCTSIFKAGQTLPEGFDGCYDGDDVGPVAQYDCADGTEYAYYDDRFGSTYGGEVVKVSSFADVCKGNGGHS